MKDKEIIGQISDGESLDYQGLDSKQSEDWLLICWEVAFLVDNPRTANVEILYDNCPASIKSDILTLGMDNEAVRGKIIEWLKTQFKTQICQVKKI